MQFVRSIGLVLVGVMAIYFYNAGFLHSAERQENETRICASGLNFGLKIVVQDEAGDPITDAVVEVLDGSYQETLGPDSNGTYWAAAGRAGNYTVSVFKGGSRLVSETVPVKVAGSCREDVETEARTYTLRGGSQGLPPNLRTHKAGAKGLGV